MYKERKQLVEFFAVCLTKVSHNVIVVQIPIRKKQYKRRKKNLHNVSLKAFEIQFT